MLVLSTGWRVNLILINMLIGGPEGRSAMRRRNWILLLETYYVGKWVYTIAFDVKGAFDTMPHDQLMEALLNFGQWSTHGCGLGPLGFF